MKVSEFKHYECDPDIMTVNDLYEHCSRLMNEGLGNRLVLIPNEVEYIRNKFRTEYRYLHNSIDINEHSHLYVYLDILTNEEENYVNKELYS